MISEQKIRLFLSLSETLNFTETANQLFITQQAVSKHIAQLEADLGFQLFVRSKHKVSLTPAGERCRIFFREELERMTTFIRDEQEEQNRIRKSLRIGYNNWIKFGGAVASARLRFSSMHPDISHIPETQAPDILQTKLRDRELDLILIIRRFIRNETDFEITELAHLPMSLLIKRDMAPAESVLIPEHYSDYPVWINSFLGESFADTKARARHELRLIGLTNTDIRVVSNRDSVYIAVETGEGISISCMASQIPESIVNIPAGQVDTLACVSLKSNRRKLVRTYAQILKEEFAKESGDTAFLT